MVNKPVIIFSISQIAVFCHSAKGTAAPGRCWESPWSLVLCTFFFFFFFLLGLIWLRKSTVLCHFHNLIVIQAGYTKGGPRHSNKKIIERFHCHSLHLVQRADQKLTLETERYVLHTKGAPNTFTDQCSPKAPLLPWPVCEDKNQRDELERLRNRALSWRHPKVSVRWTISSRKV